MSQIDEGIEERDEGGEWRKVEKIPGAARRPGILRVIERDWNASCIEAM